MLFNKNVLVLLFLFRGIVTFSQKTILSEEQTWLAVFNQTRFTEKWGSWTDVHFRLKNDFIKDPFSVFNPGRSHLLY